MSELRRADAALTEQDKTDIRRDLGLGTAAVANVPASGAAAAGEVVKGNDPRLTDARTPTTHSHTVGDVSGAETPAGAQAKADAAQAAAIAAAAADATTKANAAAASSVPLTQKGAANGVATLDGTGKVPSAQLPAIAISEYLGAAANQAAMLALSGQQGDWCTRTDLGTTWVISGSDPTQLASWTQLSYPVAPVTSVAGRTGAVTLSASDVSGLGTAATTDASAYATAAQGTKADGAAQIAGDLGGTPATPVVAKINGVAVTGTPTVGQVPTATSGTAATWQTPAGGGGTPGGSGTEMQYRSGASTFGAVAGSSYDGSNVTLSGLFVGNPSQANTVLSPSIVGTAGVLGRWGGGDRGAILFGVGTGHDLQLRSGTNGGTIGSTRVETNTLDVINGATPTALRAFETGSTTSNGGGTNYSRVSIQGAAGAAFQIVTEAGGTGTRRNLALSAPQVNVDGLLMPYQRTNATEPSWVNGAVFFNTDLDKLRVGGATGWETVTST